MHDLPWATVVWLDPGGVTGWCVLSVDPRYLLNADRPLRNGIRHCATGEIGGSFFEQLEEIESLFDMWPHAARGCESFHLIGTVRDGKAAIHTIGIWAVSSWFAYLEGKKLMTQAPNLGLANLDQVRMRELRLWEVGEGKDARAAKAHAITFVKRCRNQGNGEILRKVAWPEIFEGKLS